MTSEQRLGGGEPCGYLGTASQVAGTASAKAWGNVPRILEEWQRSLGGLMSRGSEGQSMEEGVEHRGEASTRGPCGLREHFGFPSGRREAVGGFGAGC